MKKRRVVPFAILLVCALIALAWVILSPPAVPDPVYQGKKLSQWLREVNGQTGAPLKPEAAQAVAAMGTNALPYLLREACCNDSAIKEFFLSAQSKFGGRLFGSGMKSQLDRQESARIGLLALGPIAERGLIQQLTNSDPQVRYYAVGGLYDLPPYSREASEAIADRLSDKSVANCVEAILTLKHRQRDPDIAVPALIKILAGNVTDAKYSALIALASFGKAAEPAAPVLENMLTNAATDLRPGISNALQAIRATNAPIK